MLPHHPVDHRFAGDNDETRQGKQSMTDPHSDIAGIRMLIVGASSGIGRALALAAHSRGAKVSSQRAG